MPEADSTYIDIELPQLAPQHCHEADAPREAVEQLSLTTGRADYLTGIVPQERPMLPGYDSAVVLLLLGVFMFVAANFKHYSSYLRTMTQELMSVRRRANVFDDHTVSETRIMLSLIVVVCFSEAVLLMSASQPMATIGVFPLLLTMLTLSAGFYCVQLAAYSVVGNTFTDATNARQWVRGFNASQALLGIALLLPALVSLFYPAMSGAMVGMGVFFYLVARIIFICKGFRIFYQNFYSLLYFILYLCALEIAPLVALYRMRDIIASI